MNYPTPSALQRLADEVDGWLELRCPERALPLVAPLLADPAARACGLSLQIRAQARLGAFDDALTSLGELRSLHPDDEWVDLTEAWCRRRADDLPGAVRCLEQLLERDRKNAVAHFNLACYLALCEERDRAIDALSVACGLDPHHRVFALDEPDFDALRTDERFRLLVRPPPSDDAAS
ncbi:MAG: TPR end-of-group domain-containing protein [Planctomycetota bacterium]